MNSDGKPTKNNGHATGGDEENRELYIVIKAYRKLKSKLLVTNSSLHSYSEKVIHQKIQKIFIRKENGIWWSGS